MKTSDVSLHARMGLVQSLVEGGTRERKSCCNNAFGGIDWDDEIFESIIQRNSNYSSVFCCNAISKSVCTFIASHQKLWRKNIFFSCHGKSEIDVTIIENFGYLLAGGSRTEVKTERFLEKSVLSEGNMSFSGAYYFLNSDYCSYHNIYVGFRDRYRCFYIYCK
jgi:hypothetical protein